MPRYFLNLDFAESDTIPVSTAITSLYEHGLRLDDFVYDGPAGGNPNMTISGSEDHLRAWLRAVYFAGVDPDQIGLVIGETMLNATSIHPHSDESEPDPAEQHERDTFVPRRSTSP